MPKTRRGRRPRPVLPRPVDAEVLELHLVHVDLSGLPESVRSADRAPLSVFRPS